MLSPQHCAGLASLSADRQAFYSDGDCDGKVP